MEFRRANECPRCGFAYTGFNRPNPVNSSFSERFFASLRNQRQYSGVFGKLRYVEAEHTRPWQCRCGTWLQASPWSFGWVDVLAIALLAGLHALLAARFEWARNGWVFATPIGLWVGYRLTRQVGVAEVSAPAAAETTGGRR
jgi:hypothetical protein